MASELAETVRERPKLDWTQRESIGLMSAACAPSTLPAGPGVPVVMAAKTTDMAWDA